MKYKYLHKIQQVRKKYSNVRIREREKEREKDAYIIH